MVDVIEIEALKDRDITTVGSSSPEHSDNRDVKEDASVLSDGSPHSSSGAHSSTGDDSSNASPSSGHSSSNGSSTTRGFLTGGSQEDRHIGHAKMMFLFFIMLAAAGLGTTIYFIISGSEDQDFEANVSCLDGVSVSFLFVPHSHHPLSYSLLTRPMKLLNHPMKMFSRYSQHLKVLP